MRTAALLCLVLLGCDDGRTGPDAGRDAASDDAGRAADAGTDAASPDAGPRACADLVGARRVPIDPTGPLTQIHTAAAFDGDGIWIVYNLPEAGGTGLFDVFATRMRCDGTIAVEPILVNSDSAGNDVDPDLAIAGDRMLVVWMVDDGTGGTSNLQLRYRLFSTGGAPLGDQRLLRTSRAGTPITDNHVAGDVIALDDGRFVVSGARAVPEVLRFQAFAQVLTPEGELDGEALESAPEAMISHRDVAVTSDGSIWIAYDRELDSGEATVFVRSFGATDPEPALAAGESGGPDLVAAGSSVWAAFAGPAPTDVQIQLVDVALPAGERVPTMAGTAGRIDHTPKLARSPDGAIAIAWYTNVGGLANELHVARVGPDGTVGTPMLAHASAAPYPPALTHVTGDHWLVAWSEGRSPDLRAIARIVELP